MKQLRTMKDFINASVVFVDGDMVSDGNGNGVDKILATTAGTCSKSIKMHSFAWRKNKHGSTPDFLGEVEYELENGDEGIAPLSMLRFEKFSDDYNPQSQCVKQWRPHIAPEPEPVVLLKIKYTTEDKAAGKIPLIGSLASTLAGDECTVLGHDIANDRSAIQFTDDNTLQIVSTSLLKPVLTECEKWRDAVRNCSGLAFEDSQLDAIYNGMLDGKIPVPNP